MKVFAIALALVLTISRSQAGILLEGLFAASGQHEAAPEHQPLPEHQESHEHHQQQHQEYHIVPEQEPQHKVHTLIKQIEVPQPVDKYIRIDRPIPIPVDRVVQIDRPYEVIKYVPQPYIVKVERPYNVPVIKEIPVPQSIFEVQPILANDIVEEIHHGHPHHHSHSHSHSHGWDK